MPITELRTRRTEVLLSKSIQLIEHKLTLLNFHYESGSEIVFH